MSESIEKQGDSKLLSPPVTPERRNCGVKRDSSHIEDESINDTNKPVRKIKKTRERRKSEEEVVMSIRRAKMFSRANIINFIRSYNHPFLQEDPKPKKKRVVRKPSGIVMKEYPVKIDSPSDVLHDSEGTDSIEAIFSSNSSFSKNNGSGYSTRSKNKSVTSKSIDSMKSPKTSNGSTGKKQNASPKINIKDFNFNGKDDFLRLGSVQLIHDCSAEDIPDFKPLVALNDDQFSKILKKFGVNVNKGVTESKKESIITNALKLTPQQLFDTKKRFFAEKARKTFHKMTFKKTDAQKACKIDVNKASKLYEIYNSCGLLDDQLYSV